MKFINPRTDFAFKRIFGSESDTSKLISLLNAVLQAQGKEQKNAQDEQSNQELPH